MDKLFKVLLGVTLGLVFPVTMSGQSTAQVGSITGIWESKRYPGPAVEGTLYVNNLNGKWSAQIAQFSVPVTVKGNRIAFELPASEGQFEGRLLTNHSSIRGHWFQSGNNFISPVVLASHGKDHWWGDVAPLKNEWTMYLVINKKNDGSFGAFLRNPEKNRGFFWYLDRVEKYEGNKIKLIGKFLNRGQERVFGEGIYYPEQDLLSIYFSERSSTYDFKRVSDDRVPGFYAIGKDADEYHAPIVTADGWKVGTLEEVGIAAAPLDELRQIINTPPASVHDLDLHALLVARHGKLVFEEYFHGFHRMRPHDIRSAGKVVATTMLGAIIRSGGMLSESTHVYDLLYSGRLPEGLDPRKKEMTVRHLLTMSSGYDCDDWADSQRPGSEDSLEEQAPRDYYMFTLNLPMISRPGEKRAYCSVNANLIGAVLRSATGRPIQELFQDLIARPLQIRRYYLSPQPTGEPYLAGSMYFLPRDFMKFAQVMLDGGVWNGRRILDKEFAKRAGSPLGKIEGQSPGMSYGYLWWTVEYPYRGRTIQAFFASGNGGQAAMAIPELDLVIAFCGGNYNDRAGWLMVKEYVPKFILAAIKDKPRPKGGRVVANRSHLNMIANFKE